MKTIIKLFHMSFLAAKIMAGQIRKMKYHEIYEATLYLMYRYAVSVDVNDRAIQCRIYRAKLDLNIIKGIPRSILSEIRESHHYPLLQQSLLEPAYRIVELFARKEITLVEMVYSLENLLTDDGQNYGLLQAYGITERQISSLRGYTRSVLLVMEVEPNIRFLLQQAEKGTTADFEYIDRAMSI